MELDGNGNDIIYKWLQNKYILVDTDLDFVQNNSPLLASKEI